MTFSFDSLFTTFAIIISILSSFVYTYWIRSKLSAFEKESHDEKQIIEHLTKVRNLSFIASMIPFAFLLIDSIFLSKKYPVSLAVLGFIILVWNSNTQFSIEKKLRGLQATKSKNLILQLRMFFSIIFINSIYLYLSSSALEHTDDFLRILGIHPTQRLTAGNILFPFIIFVCLFIPFYFSPLLVRLMLPSKKITNGNLLGILKQELSQAGLPSYQCYSLELEQFGSFNALVVGTAWGKGPAKPSIFVSKSLLTHLNELEFRSIIRHEIGHLKLKHIRKRFLMSFLAYVVPSVILISIAFFLLPDEFQEIGITLAIIGAVICQIFLLRRQTRFQEMEADAYAVFNLGSSIDDFEGALKKLSSLNHVKYNKKELSSLSCAYSAHPTSDFRISELHRRQQLKFAGKPLFDKSEWYKDLLVGTPRLVLNTVLVLLIFSMTLFTYQEWPKFKLHRAIANGEINTAKKLIKKGISIEAASIYSHGKSPLYTAIENNRTNIALFLIQSGAPFKIDKKNKISYLSLAANRGHLDSVKLILLQGVDINEANSEKTALIYAAEEGHLEVVKYLHSQGAKLDQKTKSSKSDALLLASRHGHLDVVKYLVENGCDVNSKDNHGSTPLIMASYFGYTDIARYLVSKKASLNDQDNDGDSALKMARLEGFRDFEKLLLSAGASDERSLRRLAEEQP